MRTYLFACVCVVLCPMWARAESLVEKASTADILNRCSAQSRTVDPFGLSENPSGAALASAENVSPPSSDRERFLQATQSLEIRGVTPRRGEIFVGARALRSGQVLRMRNGEGTIDLRLVRVSSTSVIFENCADSTRQAIALTIVPRMNPGGGDVEVR